MKNKLKSLPLSLGLFRPKCYSLPPWAHSLGRLLLLHLPLWAAGPTFLFPSLRSPICLPPLNTNNFLASKWFQMKNYQQQSCITYQDLQFLFWSFFYVTLCWTVWIWISNYDNFKQHLQVLNDFNWKIHQHESCMTHQYL